MRASHEAGVKFDAVKFQCIQGGQIINRSPPLVLRLDRGVWPLHQTPQHICWRGRVPKLTRLVHATSKVAQDLVFFLNPLLLASMPDLFVEGNTDSGCV